MPGITLTLHDAKRMAAALVPHISKDAVTPVLGGVVLGGKRGNFAYASDRYTVGRYDLTNVVIGDMPEDDFFIPKTVLSAVRSLGPATLPNEIVMENYQLRIETLEVDNLTYIVAKIMWRYEDGSDMVHWMRTWHSPTNDKRRPSTFPAVDRLFAEAYPGAKRWRTHLGAEHLEKFIGYARLVSSPIRLTMTGPSNSGKEDSPIVVEIGTRFKGLIQPIMVMDHHGFGADLVMDNATRRDEVADATTLQAEPNAEASE